MSKARIQEFKKQIILEAAFELFSTQGFDGVTMEEIAETAGLSKATLYAYFDSKNAILFNVLRNTLAKGCSDIQDIIDQNPNSLIALEEIIDMHYWGFRRVSELVRTMMHRIGLEAFDPMWKEELSRLFARKIDLLAEILSRGMKDGYLRSGDPNKLAYLLEGTIRGVCLPRLNYTLPDDDRELIILKSVIFNGISSTGEEKTINA